MNLFSPSVIFLRNKLIFYHKKTAEILLVHNKKDLNGKTKFLMLYLIQVEVPMLDQRSKLESKQFIMIVKIFLSIKDDLLSVIISIRFR